MYWKAMAYSFSSGWGQDEYLCGKVIRLYLACSVPTAEGVLYTHTCKTVPGKGIVLGPNTRTYVGACERRQVLFLSLASVKRSCLP